MFESCIQAFTTQASVGILILSWLAQKSGFSFEKLRSPSGFVEWRKIDMIAKLITGFSRLSKHFRAKLQMA